MREFRRWRVYETIEPFGAHWLIEQNAVLLARVFNHWRGRNESAYHADDFSPRTRRRESQSGAQMLAQWKAFVARNNAMVKKAK